MERGKKMSISVNEGRKGRQVKGEKSREDKRGRKEGGQGQEMEETGRIK